jgi:hypothetical protein
MKPVPWVFEPLKSTRTLVPAWLAVSVTETTKAESSTEDQRDHVDLVIRISLGTCPNAKRCAF